MRYLKSFLILLFIASSFLSTGQVAPQNFQNPILSGFNPDPSICRVNDDYYIVVSSFAWYPAMPIYHSKDLVNWKLIGHGIDRPDMINLDGINDNHGIYAATIRYHEGLFYIITTAEKAGGNFYITANDPKGPWSDPVWLKDAPGIDPSLFWDDDGRCYYTGNTWDFKKSWPSQCAIWMQELDLSQGKLVGERKVLTHGHANNAAFVEAPHLYKINGKYILITAEGGTEINHAVTVHQSNTLWGPYVSDRINPVLSHRQLGNKAPVQATGHADLVQTQNGDWYAVALGKRMVDGEILLSRESFLCKVEFEGSTPIFNPGHGKVLAEQERPDLPWTPVAPEPTMDEFDSDELASKWYFVRIPQKKFYNSDKGHLALSLQPEVIDSLVNSAMIIQKIKHHKFTATTKQTFKTKKDNEQAGLVLYRTNNSYYTLMKDKSGIVLTRKFKGSKEIVAQIPYDKSEVYFNVTGDGLKVSFSFGDSLENMRNIGGEQSLKVIADDNVINKFNGTGVGMYATSSGLKSSNSASFDWFEYKENK